MVAYPHPARGAGLEAAASRLRLWRIALAVAAAIVVSRFDLALKAASLAAGHVAPAVDTPTTSLRPIGTLAMGLVALAGVLWLPRVCLPGALLAIGGLTSNLVSLAVWHAVPDPFSAPIDGGVLHFNLADVCIWGGGAVFLLSAITTIALMPAERFASS